MISVPNENILKLRELTDEICDSSLDDNYKIVLKKLKTIVQEGKNEINRTISSQSRIKCYEKMCSNITLVLNEIK